MKLFLRILIAALLSTAWGLYSGGPAGGYDAAPQGYHNNGITPDEGRPVQIVRRYSGVCRTQHGSTPETQIIRTRSAFLNFIRTIPPKEIGMGPMPDSKDPLLRRPYINFNRYMLVIVKNPAPLRYHGPRIKRITAASGQTTVHFSMVQRRRDQMSQWPYGIGYYEAAVIPRTATARFQRSTD